MRQSRRRFVICSGVAASAILAGCVSEDTDDENGAGNGNDDESCDPLSPDFVDEPPHDPERPPLPTNGTADDWNDHYLGEGMDEAPSLAFDRINLRPDDQNDIVPEPVEYGGESVFDAHLITSRSEFDEGFEPVGEESETRADDIDFEEEVVVFVLSGFDSSSVTHEWVRVEDHCEEVRVHGYYVSPMEQTSDATLRYSGVVIERPDDELERAWVSLTTSEDRRVNFPTDEGLQVVDETEEGNEDSDEGGYGPIERTEVVPATREYAGDWWYDGTDETGVAVHLTDEEEVRALVDAHESVDRFIEGTDFEDDAVFYVESAGPNACFRTLEVREVVAVADDDSYFVTAEIEATEDESDACAPDITYPGALVRVESEVPLRTGEFYVTDGWDNEETVKAVSMGEFAAE